MKKITEKNRPGLKICVVTGIPPLNLLVHNFVQVLEPTVDELVLITGNYPEKDVFSPKIKLININHDSKKQSLIIRIPKFIIMQLKFTLNLIKNLPQTKMVIFFLDGGLYLLPLLAAKLTGRKTLAVITQSSSKIAKQTNKCKFLPLVMTILENTTRKLAHKLVIYSPNICRQFNLEKHENKIIIAHEHFIDFKVFKIIQPLGKRNNQVGYIGRFSAEKGILNFIKAIGLLNNDAKNSFYVIGDGELKEEVKKLINQENLNKRVKLLGWVPHEELPKQLNEMKLLVIPSYTEGLVNVMLEAMACGTPVLATAVGAIPDVIKDGKTGFILEDNNPETIAKGIIRALNHPNLEQIVANARALVEKEFTFEAAVERYRKIFDEILINKKA
ncbi:MAG: hypothetical protein STSR0004_22300 [Peptococcaceae bacterium]